MAIPGSEASHAVDNSAALETFGNVMKRIHVTWGTAECDLYLQSLFLDTRGGTRRGFPMEAAEELMFLTRLNKTLRAMPLTERLHIPLSEALRIIDQQDDAQLAESPWSNPSVVADTSNQLRNSTRATSATAAPRGIRPSETKGRSSGALWVILLILLSLAVYLLYPSLSQ